MLQFAPIYLLLKRVPRAVVGLFILVVVVVPGVLTVEFVASLVQERELAARYETNSARVSELSIRIEQELTAVTYYSKGLASYLAANPSAPLETFRGIAKELAIESPLVINVALAPDNVVTFVHPMLGNESVLGLDYRQSESQWPPIAEIMKSGEPKLVGPLTLVQGGVGLIVRIPIYVGQGGKRRYWGVISVVIDFDGLLDKVGWNRSTESLELAMRRVGDSVEPERVFLGDEAVFQGAGHIERQLSFPGSIWVLAAQPRMETRWMVPSALARVAGYAALLLIIGLTILLVWEYREASRSAFFDHLTGLPNRRYLFHVMEQQVAWFQRHRQGFAIAYLDVNYFKQVNDRFGHAVGDELLIEIARRLGSVLRTNDTVVRNGGDEFIFVLAGGLSVGAADGFKARLLTVLGEEFSSGSVTLTPSCSIGVARYPEDAQQIDQLLAVADRRMYEMKAAGRS